MIIYLYKKTHNKTGLQYLGKTKKDPTLYKGSGTYWLNHIKKYGYDVTTEIIRECSNNTEVKEWGMYYSRLWNIVRSTKWANLREETGDGGDTSTSPNYIKSLLTRKKLFGKDNPMFGGFSDSHRENLSKARQGIKPPNFEKWVIANKGKSYYNNTKEEKRFLPADVPVGWDKGRLKKQCKCGKFVDVSNLRRHHKNC
jgi:hypothetical protein